MPDEAATPLTGEDARRTLASLVEKTTVAMLVSNGDDGLNGRPMARLPLSEPFDGSLWFFTDDRSPKVGELAGQPAAVMLQNQRAGCYVLLRGSAEITRDVARAKALWSSRHRAWWPGGPDDPHLVLCRFLPADGKYWVTSRRPFAALFASAKAMATGRPSVTNTHGSLRFA